MTRTEHDLRVGSTDGTGRKIDQGFYTVAELFTRHRDRTRRVRDRRVPVHRREQLIQGHGMIECHAGIGARLRALRSHGTCDWYWQGLRHRDALARLAALTLDVSSVLSVAAEHVSRIDFSFDVHQDGCTKIRDDDIRYRLALRKISSDR
jgi:hypothetical protein